MVDSFDKIISQVESYSLLNITRARARTHTHTHTRTHARTHTHVRSHNNNNNNRLLMKGVRLWKDCCHLAKISNFARERNVRIRKYQRRSSWTIMAALLLFQQTLSPSSLTHSHPVASHPVCYRFCAGVQSVTDSAQVWLAGNSLAKCSGLGDLCSCVLFANKWYNVL